MKAWTKIGASGQVAVLGLVGVSAAFGLWRLVEAPPVPQKESLTEIVAEQSAAPVRGEGDPVAEEPPQSLAATDMPQEAPEGAEAPVDTVQAPSLTPSEPSLSETAEESSAPLAPQILTWLVTPDGSATIAGRSEPEAEISVLVDEIPVAIVKATRAGEFAVVAALAPNPEPSLLRVMAKLSDGREIAAKEVIALAPIAGLKGMEVQASADIGADTAGGGSLVQDMSSPQQMGLLLSDGGAALLQPAARSEPALSEMALSVQTITYSADGKVQLAGVAPEGARLRVYLDQVEKAEGQADASGRWQAVLGEIEPGLYAMRVEALAADGELLALYDTPFQRESLETLAAASGQEKPPVQLESQGNAPEMISVAPEVMEATEAAAIPSGAELVETAGETVDQTFGAAGAAADPVARPKVSITVQPGHTLWAIAKGELGEGVAYVQVFEANRDKIRDPDLIYPGQVVTIPR